MKMLIFNGLRSCPHPLRSTDSKMTNIFVEGHQLVLPLDCHFVFKNTRDFRDLYRENTSACIFSVYPSNTLFRQKGI